MIKFFRRIRQKLLSENKFSKYLIYAIGEIVLVVIGILIAFSISSWNEKRLEANQEKITLSNLNGEFQDNLRDLDSINAKLSNTIANMEHLFAMFNKKESQYDSSTLDSIISKILTSPTWKPSEFVLNDLKNSGGLSKLRNKELKKLLFQWTRYYNEMKEMAIQTEKTSIDIVEFLKIHGSLRNVDTSTPNFRYERSKLNIDNLSLLQNPQFENYIDDKLFVLHQTNNMSVKAKQLINQILKETAVE